MMMMNLCGKMMVGCSRISRNGVGSPLLACERSPSSSSWRGECFWTTTTTTPTRRWMSSRPKKRFYKNVGVVNSNGNYEITLDHRKLKTPSGSEFRVISEPLAHAISAEWESQKDVVLLSQMHLTGLSNTCIDNPTRTTKENLVDSSILPFLETDTILFMGDWEEEEGLRTLQEASWRPIIDWFNEKYGVELRPSDSIMNVRSVCREEDRQKIRRHLLSYNFECINGLTFGIDAIKSVFLTMAVMERRLTVEEAVKLGRLELEYQTRKWGNVEWAHDLELHDTTARLAAASIFVTAHSNTTAIKEKII